MTSSIDIGNFLAFSVFGFLDLLFSDLAHLLRLVDFVCELLLERVILIELQVWVSDHA